MEGEKNSLVFEIDKLECGGEHSGDFLVSKKMRDVWVPGRSVYAATTAAAAGEEIADRLWDIEIPHLQNRAVPW